jgi:hypothetical protein
MSTKLTLTIEKSVIEKENIIIKNVNENDNKIEEKPPIVIPEPSLEAVPSETSQEDTSDELSEYIQDYNEDYGQSIDSQNIKDELSLIKNEVEDLELQVDYGNVLNEKFFKRFFEDYGYNYHNYILVLLEQNPDLFIKEYNNLKNESINNSEEEKTGNNEKTDCK